MVVFATESSLRLGQGRFQQSHVAHAVSATVLLDPGGMNLQDFVKG
jgi:hypothetical protein